MVRISLRGAARKSPRSTRPMPPCANTATGSLVRHGGDLFERRAGALGGHEIALAARRLVMPVVEPPRRHRARPARLDLDAGQPVPLAPAHLAQPVVEAVVVMRQAGRRRGDRQRLADTPQRTCAHDHARRLVAGLPQLLGQPASHGLRLRPTGRRQRRVEMALGALLGVPVRLAMAKEIDGMMHLVPAVSARPRGSSAWSTPRAGR